ncbi:hypothetical protein HD554DRAFT_1685585 [Boletus coccyginus]|nr:hypothetical protein HD554DRAFT_1685585 [Boletus coccyginus]
MDLTTLSMTSEHKVHFSWQAENLVVRAQHCQSDDVLQLIPSRKLQQDLPPSLVDGHIHWLNLSTSVIEIRPLEKLWEESSENWKIDCVSGQYRMYRGREILVDIRSPTWAMVSKCLCNFYGCFDTPGLREEPEDKSRDLITTSSVDSVQSTSLPQLSVTLPRCGLSFFVNERKELESHDFKDMVYDEDQSIGALLGLENLLVLRPKSHLAGSLVPEALIPRRVLIPNGNLTTVRDHKVKIDAGFYSRGTDAPSYYTYDVDTELGCLIGNRSLESMGYLAYLHAMTSCYWPDPLTGKTGAHAALHLLQSAGCRSIMKPKTLPLPVSDPLTNYPQFNLTWYKICERYYWNCESAWGRCVSEEMDESKNKWARAMGRAAHLFPWNVTVPTTSEDRGPIFFLSQWQSDSKPEGDSASTVLASATPPALPRRAASLRYTSDNENAQWSITLDQLLFNRPAPELPPRHTSLPVTSHKTSLGDIPELNQLFPRFHIGRFDPPFKERYLALLETSTGVSEEPPQIHEVAGKNRIDTLRKHYAQCRTNYMGALSILKKRLGPTTNHAQALNQFGQWPPITPCDLLQCLAPTSTIKLSVKWKKCITLFALLLLDLQRSRRLLRFALGGLEEEFSKELENEGCGGWNAEEYPDWLLIQIQGNFLIRRNQAEIAMEMMSPRSGKNTVMQVNMGEGKSSVIIPIIAAALADGKQLVRVIVPKALTAQMFELLVARLGGLTNRPIYHLPFSRTPEYEEDGYVISLQIHDLRELMSQCMAKRGILLIQPEHVVSLKLMAVEQQVHKGKLAAGPFPKLHQTLYKQVTTALSLKSIPEASLVGSIFRWLSQAPDHPRSKDAVQAEYYKDPYYASGTSLQKLIQSHVRDIVDESDEIFHPRFQLIYTIGLEQHMDGYPDRWTITQQVLGLAKDHAHTISKNHPESMEYECGPPGSFPRVHFVQSSDVGRRLISLIIEDVMGGRLPNFNFQHIPTALHDAIRSFVSDEDILPLSDTAKDVEEYAKGSDQNHLWSGLLLLRGLLASGTLLFALTERRWRVDYGLISPAQQRAGCGRLFGSTSPTMLAVPYRAKDVPAPNTQFGHPDLTIILTCLSYYYTGLSKEQLRIAFEILLDQDDPSMEYALWVKGYDSETLPDSLRELGEINLESSEKWDNVIYPLFSRIQATIDLYLSQVVFPKEAKEFPWKISGSSWDLAEKREKLITGFSGTNDSRWLLPMSIAQHDLDHQKGTNARVLSYLLQPENDFYIVTRRKGDRQTTQLLRSVTMQRPEIRVLLDIGAQILDFSNRQVAGAWLDIAHAADGAIYFNENDELMILTRYSVTQPMLSSPLSHQVDRCIVYLDHAHTRGTDIKIPIESRAAVTLGPKVTKDALVQGCMRMRKLGRGHSVMFFAPPEVDQSIRAVAGKKDLNTRVTTADVLCWAINETWTDMQQRAPYWAQQGMNHKSRYAAWSRFCNNELTPELLSDAWLQPELKSLSNLYAPRESRNAQNDLSALDPGIRRRCEDLGIRSFPGARVEEELEREVQREREREREVELPPRARPARHNLHQDVVAFVKTGVIPPLQSGSAFLPVFTSLERSSAATRDSDVWSPLILATADFYNTIDPESTQGTMDQYLRPVQWILSRKQGRGQLLVLLSPFEANLLMPDIRASEYVHLHLYAPRTSQRMKPFDDLRLYSIPPLPSDWTPPWDLIDQLNMFAGQLYLRDYTSYLRLCRFLGVPTSMTDSPNDTAIRRNLFKIPGTFEEMEVTFSGSPLPPVMALLAIRNRRRPFARTHMGKILQGQLLEKKDFEVPTSAMSDHNPATTTEISDATSEPPQKRIRAD